MAEKPKRKNDELNLRRYWWIFGILAFLLLIPLRTPEYFVYTLTWYIALFFVVGNVAVEFLRSYGSRHAIVVLMLVCLIMPFAQLWFMTQHEPMLFVKCESKQVGIFTVLDCNAACYFDNPMNADMARYVTVFRLPVSLLVQPIWDEDFPAVCARIY